MISQWQNRLPAILIIIISVLTMLGLIGCGSLVVQRVAISDTLTPEVRTQSPTPFQPLPTFTHTPTASRTPTLTPTPSPTNTPTITPTSTETATPTGIWPPDFVYLKNVTGHYQTYNLSCEARVAVDLAAYFGTNISEKEFLTSLPVSDNPEVGFVGNYNGYWGLTPPNDYGVHARPVAALLRAHGVKAEEHYNYSWQSLQIELASQRPVMVWVVGAVWTGTAIPYTAQDGTKTIVAPFEHTVMVIGYDSATVYILDGAAVYRRSIAEFLDSWSVLQNQAITISQ